MFWKFKWSRKLHKCDWGSIYMRKDPLKQKNFDVKNG